MRIDLISGLASQTFRGAWRRRVDAKLGAARVHYLSLEDLILEKEHWSRPQDLADLAVLRAIRPRRR